MKTVTVTGASGYLGGMIVKLLSDRGYKVRATVRSKEKEYKYLRSIPNVELFEADLLIDRSFDKAFEGPVDCVFHVAAVVQFKADDPVKEIVEPAVKGMENVFKSILKEKVPYVVFTSSCAAVRRNDVSPLNEEHFNETTDPIKTPYNHAKVTSEKLLWKLSSENKDKVSISVICPSLILGPFVGDNDKTLSVSLIKKLVDGTWAEEGSGVSGITTCDIRDVAMTHILAYEKNQVNERFIISSSGPTGGLDWAKLIKEGKYGGHEFQFPTRNSEDGLGRMEYFDNSKVLKLLGVEQLTPLKKTLEDMIDHFYTVGILQKK